MKIPCRRWALLLAIAINAGLLFPTPLLAALSASASACSPFEYQGKPINPALVRAFEPFVSDDVPPITVKLNVSAAQDSNEYFQKFETSRSGEIGYENGGNRFAYKLVGCAKGTYVLRTFASSEGSGIFQSLLLVRMKQELAYDADGQSRSLQTFLTVQRRLVLGDRDTAKASLAGSTLTISKSRYRDHVLNIDLNEPNAGDAEP
jgi:hypothetical protein